MSDARDVNTIRTSTTKCWSHEEHWSGCSRCQGDLDGDFYAHTSERMGGLQGVIALCSTKCLGEHLVAVGEMPPDGVISVAMDEGNIDWDSLFLFEIEVEDDSDEAAFAAMERLAGNLLGGDSGDARG